MTSLISAQRRSGGIAHIANLGGLVGAWLYLRWLGSRPAAAWPKKPAPHVPDSVPAHERWKKIDPASTASDQPQGGTLTPGDREFLDRFSQVQ